MTTKNKNAIVANGGWVVRKFPHKPRALTCSVIALVLLIPILMLVLSNRDWLNWMGFTLLPFDLLLAGMAIRFFRHEVRRETALVRNPDFDLRKLY